MSTTGSAAGAFSTWLVLSCLFHAAFGNMDELGIALRMYGHRRSSARPASRRRQDTRLAKLGANAIAQDMSVDAAELLDEATGSAAVARLAEGSMQRLGPNLHIGPLACRIAELVNVVTSQAGWSVHALFAKLLVPALECMRAPKSRAFGIHLAAMKVLWKPEDWPDPDEKRAARLSRLVEANFLSGSDLTTGAWLLSHLRLDQFFSPDELFRRLHVNMQALRIYCVHASRRLQRHMVEQLVCCARAAPRRERRAMLSVAADLIVVCDLDRNEFLEVARQKAINWMCYMVHKVPWWVAEDYAHGDPELLALCVDQLVGVQDHEGAAALYQRHRSCLGNLLKPEVLQCVQQVPVTFHHEWDSFKPGNASALVLPLAEKDVIWVDGVDQVSLVEATVLQQPIVGIDLEWSAFGDWLEPNLCLLQVAVPDRVFLVDLLEDSIRDSVPALLQALFGARRPLLLCFSFHNDLRELARSPWAAACRNLKGTCDLQALGGGAKSEFEGLASLVLRTMGKPLCKAEQRSSWRRRPLRAAQRHYAALDAYVLLQAGAALAQVPLEDAEGVASALEQR